VGENEKETIRMEEKQLVGEKAAEYVKSGMTVGLGTGSTVYYTIMKIGSMVREGLQIQAIPSSVQTEKLAKEQQIPLITFKEASSIDLTIDGADEVNPNLDCIKGGGGALLREKIIAKAADTFIVVADSSKMVQTLGSFKLPVEVVPFGYEKTEQMIRALGCTTKLRLHHEQPYITDNGNYIVDCDFSEIHDPAALEQALNMTPGVVENGLFVGMADTVISLDANKQLSIQSRD
jgi:ribose 5-phosphate isomerase A